jgi:hemoglobin/transferrin/lactoferrin receptor protein
VNNFFANPASGYVSDPNPDLGPERSQSYEAGLRWIGDNLVASITAFRSEYDDFISQEVIGGSFTPQDPAVFQFINLDSARIHGLEARADLNLDNGIFGRFAMAYADGEIRSPGQPDAALSTIDPYNLVAGAGYRDPGGRFGLEAVLTYNARKDLEDTTGVCQAECFRPDSFAIVDLLAWVDITPMLKLRGGIFNLTDETYAFWSDVRGLAADSGITEAFTRPGRNASVSLSFTF